MAMALVPAVLTLNVSPCSFSVAVDTITVKSGRSHQTRAVAPTLSTITGLVHDILDVALPRALALLSATRSLPAGSAANLRALEPERIRPCESSSFSV